MLFMRKIKLFLLVTFVCLGGVVSASYNKDTVDLLLRYDFGIHEGMPEGWIYEESAKCLSALSFSSQYTGKEGQSCAVFQDSGRGNSGQWILDLTEQTAHVLPSVRGQGHVALIYRNTGLKNATFFVYGMNPCENVVYSDSIRLAGMNRWDTVTIELDLERFSLLQTRIYCNDSSEESRIDTLFLKAIEVCAWEAQGIRSDADIPRDLADWGKKAWRDGFLEEVPVSDARILSLGYVDNRQTDDMYCSYALLKRQIERGGCRSVFMQIPVVAALYANRYVEGDRRVARKSLQKCLRSYSFSEKDVAFFMGFMDWLLVYNRDHSEKVRLFGLDIVGYGNHEALCDYVGLFRNDSGRSAPVDSLYTLLIDDMKDFPFMLSNVKGFLKEHRKALESIMGNDVELLSLYFEEMGLFAWDEITNSYLRDSRMFHNFMYQYDIFDLGRRQTVLLGNIGYVHATRCVRPFLHSLGTLLKERFDNGYVCWGLVSLGREITDKKGFDCRFSDMSTEKRLYSVFLDLAPYGMTKDIICPQDYADGWVFFKILNQN